MTMHWKCKPLSECTLAEIDEALRYHESDWLQWSDGVSWLNARKEIRIWRELAEIKATMILSEEAETYRLRVARNKHRK